MVTVMTVAVAVAVVVAVVAAVATVATATATVATAGVGDRISRVQLPPPAMRNDAAQPSREIAKAARQSYDATSV